MIQSIPAGGCGLQWPIVKRRKWLVLTALAMEAKAITGEIGWKPGDVDVSVAEIGIRVGDLIGAAWSGFDGHSGGYGMIQCLALEMWFVMARRRSLGGFASAARGGFIRPIIWWPRQLRRSGCFGRRGVWLWIWRGESWAAAESAGVPFLHIRYQRFGRAECAGAACE